MLKCLYSFNLCRSQEVCPYIPDRQCPPGELNRLLNLAAQCPNLGSVIPAIQYRGIAQKIKEDKSE